MCHGRCAGQHTKTDVVFVQKRIWIRLQHRPLAKFREQTCQFENIRASIDENRMLRHHPDKISAIDIVIQHGSGEMMSLDKLDRLDWAGVVYLVYEILAVWKSTQHDQQKR